MSDRALQVEEGDIIVFHDLDILVEYRVTTPDGHMILPGGDKMLLGSFATVKGLDSCFKGAFQYEGYSIPVDAVRVVSKWYDYD